MPNVVKKTKNASGTGAKSPRRPRAKVQATEAPTAPQPQLAEPENAPEIPTRSEQTGLTLQSSRKFWLYVLGCGVAVIAAVQIYGYVTAWGNPEKVIQRHFDTAQRMTLAKRYDVAIREYGKIVKKSANPETIRQAQIGMAELYQETQSWDKAIAIYQNLEKGQPNQTMTAWAALKLAESQLSAGNMAAAFTTYQDIMAKYPHSDWDAEARLGTAKIYQQQQKFTEAIAVYQGLEKDYQGGFLAAEALTQVGLCYEKMGNVRDAKLAFEAVLKKYPDMMQDEAKKYLDRLERNQEPAGVRTWGE